MSKSFREWIETDYRDDTDRSMDEAPRWVFLIVLCIPVFIIYLAIKLASWAFSLIA